jgi:hypothetical protein
MRLVVVELAPLAPPSLAARQRQVGALVLPAHADADPGLRNARRGLRGQRDLLVVRVALALLAGVQLGVELAAVVRVALAEDPLAVPVRLIPLDVLYVGTAETLLRDVELVVVDRLLLADADGDVRAATGSECKRCREDGASACSGTGEYEKSPHASMQTQPQQPVPQRPTGGTVEGLTRRVKP